MVIAARDTILATTLSAAIVRAKSVERDTLQNIIEKAMILIYIFDEII